MKILGVRYGHDASAALVVDGKIVADVAEERFSRIKNDGSFPINSIGYCLEAGGISSEDLDGLAIPSGWFHDHFQTFFEFPEEFEIITFTAERPRRHIVVRAWRKLSDQLGNNSRVGLFRTSSSGIGRREPTFEGNTPVLPLYHLPFKLSSNCNVFLVEHHLSHAASACYTSGWDNERALCVTMDGIGEGVSNAVWLFENNKLRCLAKYDGSSSIGWFYACATEALGWRQSRGEWKLMGLAPFGNPVEGVLSGLHPEFQNGSLIKRMDYGPVGRWNDHGANHYHRPVSREFQQIVDKLGREDFAAEVQRVAEEQAMNFILPRLEIHDCAKVACAGGFFLNVKLNQKLWYSGKLDKHWIYPNAGDPGLSVGAALMAFHSMNPKARVQQLDNLYKGPDFSHEQIKQVLDERRIKYAYHENIELIAAELLKKNYVLGWFQGRMEAGPRALGNRSILVSPLKQENRDLVNTRIKYRETFRPFCPSILSGYSSDYLVNPRDAYYMVISFDTNGRARQRIPAVVHVDGTVRPQTVRREVNPRYYDVIKAFGEITGEYAILNTSLNIRGEPIVCTPREAIKCLYDTGMDAMILGNFLVEK
tara:strand:+ start:133 stop:1911 length:1779 start_codon:yes stop_codon:yes gene_type:complete